MFAMLCMWGFVLQGKVHFKTGDVQQLISAEPTHRTDDVQQLEAYMLLL